MLNQSGLLVDLYHLSIADALLNSDIAGSQGAFTCYLRKPLPESHMLVAAGLKQFLKTFRRMRVTASFYSKLRALYGEQFSPVFWKWMRELQKRPLNVDVYALAEGSVFFPQEPIMVIKGPIEEVLLCEVAAILCTDFPTSVLTTAVLCTLAAHGRSWLEFALRRAQNVEAANEVTRLALIGGASRSSNVLGSMRLGIAASGTQAHAYVQLMRDEVAAFKHWLLVKPQAATLLIDTFDPEQGMKNAIEAFKDAQASGAQGPFRVRLDISDEAQANEMFLKLQEQIESAGMANDVCFVASGDYDPQRVSRCVMNGVPISAFGIGTCLPWSGPAGTVFKACEITTRDGVTHPLLKVHGPKTSIPGPTRTERVISSRTGFAMGDVILPFEAKLKPGTRVIDPKGGELAFQVPKKKQGYFLDDESGLLKVVSQGRICYEAPSDSATQRYLWDSQLARLPLPTDNGDPAMRGLGYAVGLSEDLYNLRQSMIEQVHS